MYLAALLAASAMATAPRATADHPGSVLSAVNEEAAAPPDKADSLSEGRDSKIEHTPVEKSPRGRVVSILPGRHTVGVTAADGRSAEQQIDVKPGKKKMDLRVEMARQGGGPSTLSVQGDPPNANVLVDGALVGRTPFQGELNPGEHLV